MKIFNFFYSFFYSFFSINYIFLKQFNFIFFDPLASCNLCVNPIMLNFLQSFDIIFSNSINFTTLIFAIILCFGFVIFLLTQANLLNLSFYPNSTFDSEKYSPYECGFAPFWTERAQFDIKFYLVALLFLVFDVELMFLLPYCISYYYLGFYSYLIFLIFFSILIIGFLVEWSVGMLVWKGEEDLYWNKNKNIKLIQNINPKRKYFEYINFYISVLDYKALNKKMKWYEKAHTAHFLWKIKFWRPYTERFFNENQYTKTDTETNPLGQAIFYGIEDCFFGSATFSYYDLYLHIEKRQKQARIERFFIWIYGEPYKQWLESLDPSDRDFAF